MSSSRLKMIDVGSHDRGSLEQHIASALNVAYLETGTPLKARDVLTALMAVAGQIVRQTPEEIRPRFLEHAEVTLRERSTAQ